MALATGNRLGPYEIVAPVGAGGMGEVYRARDTRLGREVAIKVLPSHLSSNPAVRERFDREARAISNLSHAHICTLHDIGHQDGIDYLVMELLDGESLADRTAKGPLPLKDVIRYGAEIAEALDMAHKQGIVHRDLKPGNVMITKAGAKVLDFGLAKYASDNSSFITDPSSLATEHKPLTAEGTILGTLQYMAPEQLEGRDADGRTDIFALGAILYEMSTGRRAFEGKSKASLIASIMSSEPQPISAIAPMTPPALDRVVRTCLEKDPDDRWQSARDLARELRSFSQVTDPPSQRPPARTRLLPAAAVLLGIVLAASAVVAVRQRSGAAEVSSDPARVRRFSIALPENAPLASAATPFNYLRPGFAVSPDGSQIAYVSKAGDRTQLYLRRLNELEPKAVPGTEGGFDPFFSPDGEWLGFFTFDALHKVSLKGGSPLTLTRVVNPAGGTWCDNGTIFFAAEEGEALWRVATGSGTTDQSASRVSVDRSVPHVPYPYCLPGSAGLLLSVNDPVPAQQSAPGLPASPLLTFDYASVVVLPLAKEKSAARLLVKRGYAPQYASSGHLVFARAGSLMAAPFDLAELRVTGPEVAVLEGVRMCSVALPSAQFAITRSGSLLYVPGGD